MDVPTLPEWVAMLEVGDRWSPSEGEREATESGGEKGWWLAQMGSLTAAEKDDCPAVAWVDMGMAEGGMGADLCALVLSL